MTEHMAEALKLFKEGNAVPAYQLLHKDGLSLNEAKEAIAKEIERETAVTTPIPDEQETELQKAFNQVLVFDEITMEVLHVFKTLGYRPADRSMEKCRDTNVMMHTESIIHHFGCLIRYGMNPKTLLLAYCRLLRQLPDQATAKTELKVPLADLTGSSLWVANIVAYAAVSNMIDADIKKTIANAHIMDDLLKIL